MLQLQLHFLVLIIHLTKERSSWQKCQFCVTANIGKTRSLHVCPKTYLPFRPLPKYKTFALDGNDRANPACSSRATSYRTVRIRRYSSGAWFPLSGSLPEACSNSSLLSNFLFKTIPKKETMGYFELKSIAILVQLSIFRHFFAVNTKLTM